MRTAVLFAIFCFPGGALAAGPTDLLSPPFAVVVDGAVIDLPAGDKAPIAFSNGYPWLGDFTGDGKPDLLIGQGGGFHNGSIGPHGRLRIYRNTGKIGNPHFGSPVMFDAVVPSGRIPEGWNVGVFTPQLADYDGDGRVDLLSGSTCCQDPFCFYVFRRQPDGSFGPRERIALDYPEADFDRFSEFPSNGLKSRVAVADLNGDGKPDVLVAGYGISPPAVAYGPLGERDTLTMKRLWIGTTNDDAKRQDQFPAPHLRLYLSTNPVLADWDDDGLFDLIGGTRFDNAGDGRMTGVRGVFCWRNSGELIDPKFEAPQLLVPESDTAYVTGVAVADWNADGRPDLVVSREDRDPHLPNWPVEHHKIWVYLRTHR